MNAIYKDKIQNYLLVLLNTKVVNMGFEFNDIYNAVSFLLRQDRIGQDRIEMQRNQCKVK